MSYFVKRPIPVQAWRILNRPPLSNGLPADADIKYSGTKNGEWCFAVLDVLHDTWVEGCAGDWVIRGVLGEYYPIKHDVFISTYEQVPDSIGV